MRVSLFVCGMLGSALLIGVAPAGTVLNPQGTVLFAAVMVAGAGFAAFVCSWWPGLDADGWKLWSVATLANPVFLVGVGYSIDQYDCLSGKVKGWDCMFTSFGLIVSFLCLVPPAIALALRQWRRTARHGRAD
ncbi:MAG: hypothetical protein JOY64_12175 [Alphaproteobacteria bacterium]|nr:hypothetical protein [Alphaproteobacteria bacterium]MBV8408383.1 hypothetical protein [Alphaproteobacteria bacterium]